VRPLILAFSPEGEKEQPFDCSRQLRTLPPSQNMEIEFQIRALPKSSWVRPALFLPFAFRLFPFEFKHDFTF
jgi:hypothetical protein